MKREKSSFGKPFLSKKRFAFVEIAIVLCSLFLVATLPAIAAEQTMQKLSANTVTTTSENDYALGVYGNANEDDTIDMRDLTYVKLIFFGERPETELANAKYDGEINPLDFVQIKLIIVGKEKELTIVDSADRIVTVKKPVERVIVIMPSMAEAMQVLDAVDNVVGVGSIIAGEYQSADKSKSFPMISKLPSVGFHPLDYETVLSLDSDVVIGYAWCNLDENQEHLPGITVIALNFVNPTEIEEEFQKLDYILDKRDEAEEFIEWYEEYVNTIKDRTEKLSEDKKPKIYYAGHMNIYRTQSKAGSSGRHELIVTAGGTNIAADLGSGAFQVDPEWVIEQNPDIIVVTAWAGVNGAYATDDPSGMKEVWDSVMNRPELANVAAVRNEKVFVGHYDMSLSPACCAITQVYYAKWFHPDLFDDLDPQAIHQEYVDQFKRIDFNVYEHGVFVYPPLE
jgi:iron complex transport system substrate-binding protein